MGDRLIQATTTGKESAAGKGTAGQYVIGAVEMVKNTMKALEDFILLIDKNKVDVDDVLYSFWDDTEDLCWLLSVYACVAPKDLP